MGCNHLQTEDLDRRIEANLAGENCKIPADIEKELPEIREIIAQRCVECLEENTEKARNELAEKLAKEGREPTPLERLDSEVEPTEKEYQELFKMGKELGIPEWEIVNTPAVTGIKNLATLEKIEDVRGLIKDAMAGLHNSKLSPRFRDVDVVDKIVFIDKQEPGTKRGNIARANVLGERILLGNPQLSRTVHVFQNSKGQLPKGRDAQRAISHELCHLNLFKTTAEGTPGEFGKVFLDHLNEWERACNAQLDGPGAVSRYARECIPSDGPRESAFSDPEFIAEHVAVWDSELTELAEPCPEMNEFFDKYLSG